MLFKDPRRAVVYHLFMGLLVLVITMQGDGYWLQMLRADTKNQANGVIFDKRTLLKARFRMKVSRWYVCGHLHTDDEPGSLLISW